MLPQAPGTAASSATADMADGFALTGPSAPPEAAPPEAPTAEEPPAPAAPGATAATPSAAEPPSSSSAPAAPAVTAPQVQAAQQQLYGHAQQLQQAAGVWQQRQAALQAQAQGLQALMQQLPPEQQDVLRPQAEALLRENAALEQQRNQLQAAWQEVGVAHQLLTVQAREAQLEQLAGPMALQLLVQRAAAQTPALASQEAQAEMVRRLSRYDANHLEAAAQDYVDLTKAAYLKDRAASGTDAMGGTSGGGSPPQRETTGAEDIALALRQAYDSGPVRHGKRT